MKKLLTVIPITILFILFSDYYHINADSSHYMITYAISTDQYGNLYTCKLWNAKASSTIVQNSDGTYSITNMYSNTSTEYNSSSRNSLAEAMAEIYQEAAQLSSDFIGRNYTINAQSNIILNNISYTVNNPTIGDFFPSLDDYEDSLTQDSWWDNLKDGFEDLIYGIPGVDPLRPIWDWLFDLGSDPEEPVDSIQNISTPAPTPTQIPYLVTQQTITNGDTSTTTYIYTYNDPTSGNIVTATAPPEQPGRLNTGPVNYPSGNGGNNSDPSQYHTTDPLIVPEFSWLSQNTGNEALDNPLDTLSDSLSISKTQINQYKDGATSIFDIIGQLPTELYMLLGLGVTILVIAGIIRTFLGG